MITTREELVTILNEHKEIMKERFGMYDIYMYGDFSRDEADYESYVEILAEFEEDDFDIVLDACVYLGDLTGRKIFIANEMTTNPDVLPLRIKERVAI